MTNTKWYDCGAAKPKSYTRKDKTMKHPKKNRAGVPLQFSGKAARLSYLGASADIALDAGSVNQPAAAQVKGAVQGLGKAQDATRQEIAAVAVMAEGVSGFVSQISRFQRSANLAIICTCLPLLSVYAYFGLTNI
jgi:hypothetical protein